MRRSITHAAAWLLALLIAIIPLSATAAPVGGGQASPSSEIKAYGCDLSFWNVGGYYPDYSRIDFDKMKADGCEYVILRVGFEGTATRQNTIDDAFLTLYEQAKNAGLGVGVYFYTLATTYEGAAEDAAWCIDLFERYNLSFEYPIYYDVEDPGNDADRPGHEALTPEETTRLCLGWAETLEAAGYYPGVYAGYDILIELSPAYTNKYDVWYAYVAYHEGIPEFIPEEQDHSAFCGMWQYSWKGSFDGAVGDVDVNVCYKDYPAIMKRNGYNNIKAEWRASLSVMPQHDGFTPYNYNENGEGIMPTYRNDGTVTLTNTVSTTSWSWPSAYMVCLNTVDISRYPLLTIQKSGNSHFNAVLQYVTEDGTYRSMDLAALAGEQSGEFDSGDMTITVDIAAYLRKQGHYPDSGTLRIAGITYFIMGAKNSYTTVQSATFTEAPTPDKLTSPHYTVDDTFVADVPAPITVAELLLGFDNANGVVVRDKNGTVMKSSDTVTSLMTVVIEDNGKVIKSYTLSLRGDVNGDGEATTMDARVVLGALLGTNTLNACQTRSADFDKNSSITTADVRDLLMAVLM